MVVGDRLISEIHEPLLIFVQLFKKFTDFKGFKVSPLSSQKHF
jgi:hypothetical protein